ncbi:MAG: hypothetical protein P8J32_08015 [bacterium]|nr:hypothetical protein [bacterium]
MTWTDIIKKAISEAKAGGYEMDESKIYWGQMTTGLGYYKLIFKHDFAKAIFGNGEHHDRLLEVETQNAEAEGREINLEFIPLPTWKKMLQQMVIQEEPLQWLSKAIDNKANLENVGKGVVDGTKDTSAIREMLKNQFKQD